MFGSFFKKFSKISRNFLKIFPTSKEVFFVPKIVQNHYFNQNLPKFSLKIPKIADFSLKPLIFQKFRRLWRQKFGVFCPTNPDFWSLGLSLLSWGSTNKLWLWSNSFEFPLTSKLIDWKSQNELKWCHPSFCHFTSGLDDKLRYIIVEWIEIL